MLKQVDKKKNPGLAKLPEKVRNRMGYANKGMSVKGDDKRDIRKTESMIGASKSSKREKGKMTKARTGKMIYANTGMAAKKVFPTNPSVEQEARDYYTKNFGSKKARAELGERTRDRRKVKKMGGGMMYANVGMAAKKIREKEMMKASEGKSVRGYGAARTSGMGLQDESLPPGKSLDYYKDLM